MKDFKYRLELFSFYNHTAICEHLEKMAARGWMIEKPGIGFWRYRRIEPKKLSFAVTYFPDASDFDPEPLERQRRMWEYCAEDGWNFAAQWNEMQVFYSEAEDPTPIETDAVTWTRNINDAMRIERIALKIFAVFQVIHLLSSLHDFISYPLYFLADQSELFSVSINLTILLAILFELRRYHRWHKKAKIAAESGEFLEIKKSFAVWLFASIAAALTVVSNLISAPNWLTGVLLILAALGILIATIFAGNAINRAMREKGVSHRVNKRISVAAWVLLLVIMILLLAVCLHLSGVTDTSKPVGEYVRPDGEIEEVFDEPMPPHIQDLTDEYDNEWSSVNIEHESFLLAYNLYFQEPLTEEDLPYFSYKVVQVKAPFLYDYSKNRLIKEKQENVIEGTKIYDFPYQPADPTPWGAKEVYLESRGERDDKQYLLCYEKNIVEITFRQTPTPEQMAVFAEKFA